MTLAAINRRGICPALSAPMQTGDGLLVRLNPVSESLSPKQLIGLCESASRFGNGIVEITARGSFQIRGLTAKSALALTDDVSLLGIAVRTGVPIDISPLAGLDPQEIADPRPLADAIRAFIADIGLANRLRPKVSVVIDSGGAIGLADVLADLRLTAVKRDELTPWQISLAGNEAPLATLPPREAVGMVIDMLERIAKLGPAARGRDLLVGGNVERLAQNSPLLIGLIPLQSAFALAIALPFGNMQAETLAELTRAAATLGIAEFRLAPKRRLLAICPSPATVEALAQTAAQLGFITDPDDPRLSISACSGAPACASGSFATRDVANEIVEQFPALVAPLNLHISGCAKGCAHPAQTDLTLVGGEKGVGLVVNGTARDLPLAYVEPKALVTGLARLSDVIDEERLPGEATAACIARLGPRRLANAFSGMENG